MSISISIVKTPKSSKQFPKLMSSISNDLIVLFSREGEGVVIRASNTWRTGDWSDNFAADNFEDFNGSVTLRNE